MWERDFSHVVSRGHKKRRLETLAKPSLATVSTVLSRQEGQNKNRNPKEKKEAVRETGTGLGGQNPRGFLESLNIISSS